LIDRQAMTSYHRVPSSVADPSSASSNEASNQFSSSLSNHQQHQHNGAANQYGNPTSSSASSTHSSAAAAASSTSSASSSARSNNALRRTWSERLSDKVIAVLWVLAALLVAHFSHFGDVVTRQRTPSAILPGNSTGASTNDIESSSSSSPRVPVQWLMQLAAAGIATVVLLWLYLVLYLPYVKGLTDPSAWPVYCPRVIPAIVLSFLFTYVALVRACWPVWGCLSPLIWTVEMSGLVFATHLVPWPC
jgi:cobalamin biosynthesis Mg chelatase CobN